MNDVRSAASVSCLMLSLLQGLYLFIGQFEDFAVAMQDFIMWIQWNKDLIIIINIKTSWVPANCLMTGFIFRSEPKHMNDNNIIFSSFCNYWGRL